MYNLLIPFPFHMSYMTKNYDAKSKMRYLIKLVFEYQIHCSNFSSNKEELCVHTCH